MPLLGVFLNQNRSYKSYSQAFKEEAVGLVIEQGYSVAEATRSLGIRANQLYGWKAKQEIARQNAVLSVDEPAELLRLRKENKRLLMEKEILKKAFFAKEMT